MTQTRPTLFGRACLAVLSLLAAGAATGCRSTLDRQIDMALAAARAEDRGRGTTSAAASLAQPLWWVGPPIAVPSSTSRSLAAPLGAAELQLTELPTNEERRLELRGPRVSVLLEFAGHSPSADDSTIAALIAELGVAVELGFADEGDGADAHPRPDYCVRFESVEDALASEVELRVASARSGAADATAIVARCALFDALEHLVADAVARAPVCAYVGRSDTIERTAPSDTRVTITATTGEGSAVAARAAIAVALYLADGRAVDLERYLATLDGERQARSIGPSSGHTPLPIGGELEAWHRDARRELRVLCLEIAGTDPLLLAPRRD